MRATAAGLNKPDAPVGVFLLVGPSGVGKTETALALADLLYGGDRFITTINMSEFQEKHTVSRLIGAPPGYVGYGEGGMLTEAVRQKPYSVVLLDEVEKADPDVLNLFYQIFDKGVANDGEGREIDFRNTLILMTSNLGSDHISELCENGARPSAEVLEQTIRPVLSKHFKPALLARMRVVPYYPVGGQVLRELIEIKLDRLGERLNRRQLDFTYSQHLVDHLAERCTQDDILDLARHFANKACTFLQRDEVSWSNEVLDLLGRYAFPGNVRELKGLVERAVLLCEGNELLEEHFSLRMDAIPELENLNLRERLERIERNLLIDCLRKNDGNQTLSARELGLPRRTFLYRLRRLNINVGNVDV